MKSKCLVQCFRRAVIPFVIATVISIAYAMGSQAAADVKLPEVFASNMVLQRDLPVPVWGWADAGEKVTVSFAGQTKTTTTAADGKWSLELAPLKANNEPAKLTVKGKNEIVLDNVLVGEVWICSGQSNMEWTMQRSAEYQEALKTVDNPIIRLFHIPRVSAATPQEHVNATWKKCNAANIPAFSAVGYYFGQRIQKELGVPVGLINSSWGGSRIEPWTPLAGFQSVPSLKQFADDIDARDPNSAAHQQLVAQTLAEYKKWLETTEEHYSGYKTKIVTKRNAQGVLVVEEQKTKSNEPVTKPITAPPAFPNQLLPQNAYGVPTCMYNAMIHPLVPFAVRGAIWYQGESNNGEGMVYAEKMKALINGWRNVFNNPDLGFYYVQLAPFAYGKQRKDHLAETWEAQSSVEKAYKYVGQAVINDLVSNIKDIHPPKKLPVGNRLALLALNRTYGKDVVAASPELDKMEIKDSTVVLSFKNAKELKTRDGKAPDWFEIAGADGIYHKAEAKIVGTTIELTSSNVAKSLAVRFAWDQIAEPNVQNEAGLQLGAFRAGEIPERETFDALVPDGKNFHLVYSFDPTKPVLTDNNTKLVYKTDKSGDVKKKIKRVGYFLNLKTKDGKDQFVFVTLPPLDSDIQKLGVPTKASGARFQTQVKDVTVVSNVPGIETGTFADGFNVEFWDCNYSGKNAVKVPGADDKKLDFGDALTADNSPGYGSMQIHNFAKKQTVFAFNNFSVGAAADVGIGNNPSGEPDWTFSKSAQNYAGGQLLILVETE